MKVYTNVTFITQRNFFIISFESCWLKAILNSFKNSTCFTTTKRDYDDSVTTLFLFNFTNTQALLMSNIEIYITIMILVFLEWNIMYPNLSFYSKNDILDKWNRQRPRRSLSGQIFNCPKKTIEIPEQCRKTVQT